MSEMWVVVVVEKRRARKCICTSPCTLLRSRLVASTAALDDLYLLAICSLDMIDALAASIDVDSGLSCVTTFNPPSTLTSNQSYLAALICSDQAITQPCRSSPGMLSHYVICRSLECSNRRTPPPRASFICPARGPFSFQESDHHRFFLRILYRSHDVQYMICLGVSHYSGISL